MERFFLELLVIVFNFFEKHYALVLVTKMANNYRTDIFLKKLYYIHEQCASVRKKKEEADAEANMDEFTQLRKKIASDIRKTKAVRANLLNVTYCVLKNIQLI